LENQKKKEREEGTEGAAAYRARASDIRHIWRELLGNWRARFGLIFLTFGSDGNKTKPPATSKLKPPHG